MANRPNKAQASCRTEQHILCMTTQEIFVWLRLFLRRHFDGPTLAAFVFKGFHFLSKATALQCDDNCHREVSHFLLECSDEFRATIEKCSLHQDTHRHLA